MANLSGGRDVYMGAQGRLVIPAKLRRVLGLNEGDALVARVEVGRLILEKAEITKQHLKARFSKVEKNRSLAGELIAERREEAKREK